MSVRNVRTKFCKTISELQEEEMQNFIDAYGARDLEKASRTLESLGFINELNEAICEIE